ncbi:MAG: S8 family serine peptidase [Pseudomonadales bacterium]
MPQRHHQGRASLCVTLLLLLLGACGGGGSSDGGSGGGTGSGGAGNPPPAANSPPTAAFTVSTDDGFAPLIVSFDAAGSSDSDGSIASYSWEFGDSASASGDRTTHTYADTGAFTVTLRVTDDDGASDTVSAPVRVRGATVSGVIRVGAGSAIDSDVNDRFTAPAANNSFGEAQPVLNPLRLGGFVNQPGTGSDSGNFFSAGDPDDYFAVDLQGQERIVLSIGDPSADLDLQLYNDDSTPTLVDESVSLDPTEDLQAPALPGRYFVRVLAVSGASNYVLSISEESVLALGQRRAKRLTDPFVPGELLMRESGRDAVGRYRLQPRQNGRDVGLTIDHRSYLDLPAAPQQADLALADQLAPGARISPALLERHRTLLAARAANARAGVASAEVNVLRQPLRVPNDGFYDLQWHYPAIGLEDAWDLTTGEEPGNPEVVVAVVDTGVLLGHPDLQNRLLRDAGGTVVGYDFIQDAARANDGDGIDGNPDDPGDDARGPDDGSFHGTHVAGTVAADSDNGSGVAGVSWGARLMPMRALGVDGGTTFDVMQAVRYAAGLSNISGSTPPVRADIVNMSLGSDFFSEAEQQTIDQVRAEGVFVVASAGNDSSDVPSYPASYDGVVSVAASTISGTQAYYSNFGPQVDVAAPGGDARFDLDANEQPDGVVSTLGSGGGGNVDFVYGILQGTSMAAPHVAGVIALMKAVYPGLTPAEFDALLQDGQLTDEAGAPGRDDQFGWGIINANRAVQAALLGQGGTQGTFISVSSGRLDFQAFTQTLDFEVTKIGEDPVTVVVSDDAPWLTVFPVSVNGEGFGSYRASVERAGLPPDTYTATITVSPTDPDVAERRISAIMQVTRADLDADAGQHYVILVEAEGDQSLAAQIVNASNGEYAFQLNDVAPGDYRLFAGTDLDDDDFICDGGEACGAFPGLSSPAVISIDARQQPELTDQSFTTEFRTTATTTGGSTAGGNAGGDDNAGAEGVALFRPARD